MSLLFAGLRLGEAMSTVPYIITELHWQGTPGEPPTIQAVIRMDSGLEFKIEAVPPVQPGEAWGFGVEGTFGTRAELVACEYLLGHAAELIAVLRAAVEDESAHLIPPGLRP